MDKFHYVLTAFLELGSGYQEAIEEITRRMGAGMAKFICKEVYCSLQNNMFHIVRSNNIIMKNSLLCL
jgi:hypothetical protein